MRTTAEILRIELYANEILEVIECQIRDDKDSLTQSDLQGVVSALVMRIIDERSPIIREGTQKY